MRFRICILFMVSCLCVGCGFDKSRDDDATISKEEFQQEVNQMEEESKVDLEVNEETNNKSVYVMELEELFLNITDYIGQRVQVSAKYGVYESDDGSLHIVLEDDQFWVKLDGLAEPQYAGYPVTIVGTVCEDEYNNGRIAVEGYEFGEYVEETVEVMSFEEMRNACTAYSNMNWRDFYEYPSKYCDNEQLYYFVGKVIYHDEYGGGLLQLVESDERTIIQYSVDDVDAMFYEGEVVAIWGYLKSGGEFTYTNTGETVYCPFLYGIKCMRNGGYEILNPTEEERAFIYDEFVNVDGYYEPFPGEEFEIVETGLAGYQCTINWMKYGYGTSLMSSYDAHSNNLKISINMTVDRGEWQEEVQIFLYMDGTVKCESYDYIRK